MIKSLIYFYYNFMYANNKIDILHNGEWIMNPNNVNFKKNEKLKRSFCVKWGADDQYM